MQQNPTPTPVQLPAEPGMARTTAGLTTANSGAPCNAGFMLPMGQQHNSRQVHRKACTAAVGCSAAVDARVAGTAVAQGVVQPSPIQQTTATAELSTSSTATPPDQQTNTREPSHHMRSATLAESSDLDDSSSEVSSSVSPVTHQLSLENLDFYDNGAFVFDPTSEQPTPQQLDIQQLQQQVSGQEPGQQNAVVQLQQLSSSEQASSRLTGQRQSNASQGRNSANGQLVDPDYEVPQGKLTETQVLLAHVDKLHLDRYGFIVTQEEAAKRAARAKRSSAQTRRDQRHVQKWRRMLGSSREEFMSYWASKPKKVKRRVRKGIPDEFRGLVWQYLSGGRELMQQHPGQYAQLLTVRNDTVDMEIMRDLNRTFPNHVFFHQRQGPGQQSLFHVLRAYSAYDSVVGYVQGMGFVTAILLMYMSEEEAFWTLVALLKGATVHPPLEGMYLAGMPLLQQCLYQFQELLKQENPKLGTHLEQEGVVPSMYCTHWFNTIFAYSLPFEQLLRVWDVFLLEGLKVVFRVGIVLLSSAQDELVSMPFEKLVGQLNSKTKFPVLSRHPDVLIRTALRIPVSRRLELLRERHQQQEAAAAAAANGSADSSNGRQHAAVIPVSMGPNR